MILERIEAHLRERKMSPSRFGREAVNDWKFVSQLRAGREPSGLIPTFDARA